MIHTHTIGRIGKDCRVITGTHGSFMAMDIAVDDYSKGQNVTTWVRVKSNRENHIRLAEYLTKGRLVLVDGTLSASLWEDRNGNSQTQLTITADSIAFIGACKLCSLLVSSSESISTVSTMMHGEYGIEDVCLSTLTLVGPNGVQGKVPMRMNKAEIEQLQKSADALKEIIAQIDLD